MYEALLQEEIITQEIAAYPVFNYLNVELINTEEKLISKLENGLARLYQDVFYDPPYNEKFEICDVYDRFSTILNSLGTILVISAQNNLSPIAFFASMPLRHKEDIVKLVQHEIDIKKTTYHAEIGVAKHWRKKHIATAILRLAFAMESRLPYKYALARTNIDNYKQISNFKKLGYQRLGNYLQLIEEKRNSGSVSSDTRAFYLFNLNQIKKPINFKKLSHVTIARPSGNDTAFVWDIVPRKYQVQVSQAILSYYPGIEQVMFIEKDAGTEKYYGRMAGGELCVNAIRALGFILLDGQDGETEVMASGYSSPLNIKVNNGFAKISISIKAQPVIVKQNKSSNEYVVMWGESIFLILDNKKSYVKQLLSNKPLSEKTTLVYEILKEQGMLTKSLAGILIVEPKNNAIYLHPYIYVAKTGTIYYETACGSGSIALLIIEATQTGNSLHNQKIIQPSGEILEVSILYDKGKCILATVTGKINIVFDETLHY